MEVTNWPSIFDGVPFPTLDFGGNSCPPVVDVADLSNTGSENCALCMFTIRENKGGTE